MRNQTKTNSFVWFLWLFVFAGLVTEFESYTHSAFAVDLPYDNRCPVIHDNDDHRDVYTDEYLMALAHRGDIDLKALITTYAPNQRECKLFVQGRKEIVEKARRSGMKNLPVAMAGTNNRLKKPDSNRIEDTEPLDLKASEFIVKEAKDARPRRPLVIVTGGQLTTVANAYLLDPGIADNVVVSGIFGVDQKDYNAGLDSWAWTIVLSKFRTFAVPIGPPNNRGTVYMKPPHVPKARIESELPQTIEFYKWMFEKEHPHNELPAEHDFDGQAAIPIMRPDYITKVERWRPVGILSNGNPKLVRDENGPIYKALDADQKTATEEFWRAVRINDLR